MHVREMNQVYKLETNCVQAVLILRSIHFIPFVLEYYIIGLCTTKQYGKLGSIEWSDFGRIHESQNINFLYLQ